MFEVKNLHKTYGNKTVIHDISFSVKPGQIIGLLGCNGAGKTTAFYIATGVIAVDSNKSKITLNGIDVTSTPLHVRARMGIGYLPQESSVFRGISVEDNLRIACEMCDRYKNKEEIQETIDGTLARFDLTEHRKLNAGVLSGGQRRKLEIGRLLVQKPSYLMFDEPFAGIDPISIKGVCNFICSMKNDNMGVVITDHNVKEVVSIADFNYVIYEGRVLASGTNEEILNNKDVRDKYLGND